MALIEKLKQELSKELILEIKKDGTIKYISENCIRILGYSESEMINCNLVKFLKSETDIEKISRLNNDSFELTFKHKHGRYVYVSGEIYFEKDKDNLSILLQMIDISKYKQIDQREERLRSIIENGKDLVYRFEVYPEMGFSYIRPSVKDITGYSAKEHYNDYLSSQGELFRNLVTQLLSLLLKTLLDRLEIFLLLSILIMPVTKFLR